MVGISSYNSSTISMLFSGLGNSSRTAMSGLFNINLGDYASIKSGSYGKLLSAYYGKQSADSATEKSSSSSSSKKTYNYYDYSKLSGFSVSTAKDDAKTLANVKSDAESMKSSADALLATGSKSLFTQKEIKGEDGTVTKDYDRDAIYKAVKSFADDYNNLVDSAGDSNTASIKRAANTMVNYTKANEKALSEIGITVDKDNKLSVDEDIFKNSDMSKVQSLFQRRGAYGYQIDTQAAMANSYAQTEASKSNTYTSGASYTFNYNTGSIFDSVI